MSQATLRWVTIATVVLLAVLCVLWETTLAPVRPGAWMLSLKALPLFLALPGLLAGRLRTYQWWSMLSLAYLTEGLVRGATETGIGAQLAWAEVALSTILFGAVLIYCRNARMMAQARLTPA